MTKQFYIEPLLQSLDAIMSNLPPGAKSSYLIQKYGSIRNYMLTSFKALKDFKEENARLKNENSSLEDRLVEASKSYIQTDSNTSEAYTPIDLTPENLLKIPRKKTIK